MANRGPFRSLLTVFLVAVVHPAVAQPSFFISFDDFPMSKLSNPDTTPINGKPVSCGPWPELRVTE
jgi:hypothetical protein